MKSFISPQAMTSDGFTLIEVVVALAIVTMICVAALYSFESVDRLASVAQTRGTEDRIIAGVRGLAGSPAALRNSMRALSPDGLTPANPKLLACAGGNPMNDCQNGTTFDLTLYAPVVSLDQNGVPSIQPITAPIGSANVFSFDAWGSPCLDDGSASCPLIVSTSFQAQCGPASLSVADLAAPVTPAQIAPMALCSVADQIAVTYVVQLNPAAASAPGLSAFAKAVTGTVTTPVAAISGNLPQ
jgi:prepilin-type N-terminal cleavage/methylation domain-containing protein